MTRQSRIALVFAMLWTTGYAVAQRNDANDPTDSTEIATARCAYALADAGCLKPNTAARDGGRETPVAQFPRRVPGPPPYPPRPHGVRMANPMPSHSLRGAAIGGLIGFALGAAVPKDGTVRNRVGLGIIVGLVGAGMGAAIAANHAYYYRYPRGPWPDEEETASLARRRTSDAPESRRSHRDQDMEGTVSADSGTNFSLPGTRTLIAASDEK